MTNAIRAAFKESVCKAKGYQTLRELSVPPSFPKTQKARATSPYPLLLAPKWLFSFCLDRRPSVFSFCHESGKQQPPYIFHADGNSRKTSPLLFLLPAVPFLESISSVQLFLPQPGLISGRTVEGAWCVSQGNAENPVCCFPKRNMRYRTRSLASEIANICLRCKLVALRPRQTLFMRDLGQEIQ